MPFLLLCPVLHPPPCCSIFDQALWRSTPDGRGAPLTVAAKKGTFHVYYDLLLTPEEIAPLILSQRGASGGVAFEPSMM